MRNPAGTGSPDPIEVRHQPLFDGDIEIFRLAAIEADYNSTVFRRFIASAIGFN